jgi:hypothetical protein
MLLRMTGENVTYDFLSRVMIFIFIGMYLADFQGDNALLVFLLISCE